MKWFGVLILAGVLVQPAGPAASAPPAPIVMTVFAGDSLHFRPARPEARVTEGVVTLDNGREIARRVTFPELDPDRRWRITGRLVTRPVPKDEVSVGDPWDRSACIRLRRAGQPDLELIRHVTAYGGVTAFDVDLSDLASALTGSAAIHAFVDTWLSPAWTVDFRIEFAALADTVDPNGLTAAVRTPASWVLDTAPPARVRPVVFHPWVTAELMARSAVEGAARGGAAAGKTATAGITSPPDTTELTVPVTIPAGTRRVLLRLLSTGHCTDGRDDDEFRSKDHVIRVDGRVVHRFRPWRDDCRDFRAVNPYCRRWSDGSWSSDYSRSGFCPGDLVPPVIVDLTDALKPGPHTVSLAIEGIRPKADEHLGYWRVSASLLEW